jgi:hypothetical protein
MATLIREMYNDIFSDNRNITIFVLMILLILVFSRIPLVETLSQFLYTVISNLYQFAENLVYSITYSTGEILNASSNTVTGVTKTSLDLGNGAINDVGNLLSDVNCEYKGNPVAPNQCHPPEPTPQVVYVTVPPEPTPPTTKPRRHIETPSPKVLGKMKPTSAPPVAPSFLPSLTAVPTAVQTQVPTITKQSVTYTPPHRVVTEAAPPASKEVGETQGLYSGQPLNYNSTVFVDNPLNPNPYMVGAPAVSDSVSLDNTTIKPAVNLDSVLEGLENRQMAAFQPDPIGSGAGKSKNAWCFVGEMDGKRSCVEIASSKQGCESGLVYGSSDACVS